MKILTATACICFFTFAVMRAVRVPFTYDEAASYIRYIDTSVSSDFETTSMSVFNFEVATNHFLNTVLARLAYLAAGSSEVILRMPSLIGYAMYLAFGWMLLDRLANRAIGFAGILLLNLNPYLLDFFALSRGYGLAIGLLMGALYFLFRFLAAILRGDIGDRELIRAFVFACAAALANFATLNVYVSCWMIAVIAIAAVSLMKPSSRRDWRMPDARRRPGMMMLPVTAAILTASVFSQDVRLSRDLYEPVTVRLDGLDQSALDRTSVMQIDLRGRPSRLLHDLGTPVWRSSDRTAVRRLRIEVARDAGGKLARIETVIGARAFSSEPHRPDAWTSEETNSMRVFESAGSLSLARSRMAGFQSVINWAGDAVYLQRLSFSVACALAIFVGFAAALMGGARLAERTHLFTPAHSRILVEAALWAAVLAGPPLYILKRNHELYFGGSEGLFADTFRSLIASTAYGRPSSNYQIPLLSAAALAVVAIFLRLLVTHFRARRLALLMRPSVILALLLMTTLSLVVQHITFHTVYLTGRTALFFIPLFTLFFIYVCDVLATLGRASRAFAISLATAAVLISASHFAVTANVRSTLDWPDDASTKRMIEDVGQFAATGADPGPVTLGVDPPYAPVAVYYARRNLASHIDVVVLPSPRRCDFLYVRDSVGVTNVIGRYVSTRSVLIRVP